MNSKNIVIGALAAVGVIFGVLYFKAPTVVTITETKLGNAPQVTVPAPVVNVPAPIVNVAAPKVSVNVPEQKFGAAASSDLMTPWFSFGGVSQWAGKREELATASSTVCAIQGPAATSTLDHASVRFTLASTTAVTVDLALGTNQYATTTNMISSYSVGASAQATIVASTTIGKIFAPNEWFVVRFNTYSASSGALNAPTGVCQARWTRI